MSNPRYYWLKLFESYYADDAIGWLLEQRQKDFSTIFLQICLLTMNTDGYLALKINGTLQPYPTPLIAKRIQTDLESTQKAIALLTQVGKIIIKNDLPFIPDVVHMVGSETKDAARKRAKKNSKDLPMPKKVPSLEPGESDKTNAENKKQNYENEGWKFSAQGSGNPAENFQQILDLDIRDRDKNITIIGTLKKFGVMEVKIDKLVKKFSDTQIRDGVAYFEDYRRKNPEKDVQAGFLVHCIEQGCKILAPKKKKFIICPDCQGHSMRTVQDADGYENAHLCPTCHGTGKIEVEEES